MESSINMFQDKAQVVQAPDPGSRPIEVHWMWNCATGLSFALLVSTPSIKLFISHSILNILFLSFILVVAVVRRRFSPSRTNRLSLAIWGAFTAILMFDLLLSLDSISLVTLTRTIFFSLAVAAALLAFTPSVTRWFTMFLLTWGSFVALVQLTVGVDYDRMLGQHYLTVSLPIGIALSGTLVAVLIGKLSKFQYVFLIGLAGLHLLSLATVLSRSALVYPPMVVVFVLLISRVSPFAPANMWKRGSQVLLISLIAFPLIATIDFQQLYRLELLSNYQEEDRFTLFIQTIDHINHSPVFGHGVDASIDLMGIYSHNIFLEVALTGGMVLLLPFLALMIVYLFSVRKVVLQPILGPIAPMLTGMSLFALLQWNTSYDLLTAYIPLVLVAAIGALARAPLTGANRC
jgi:O-antigen ligase